eukprot:60135_1
MKNERNPQHHTSTRTLKRCDKRRSRAARSILINTTMPILTQYDTYQVTPKNSPMSILPPSSSVHNNNPNYNHDVMSRYKSLLVSLMNAPDTCILNPNRDILWKEEDAYRSSSSRINRRQTLHQCGHCGKTFVSRYYLDLHTSTQHRDEAEALLKVEENSSSLHNHQHQHHHHHHAGNICPANEWCKLLGGSACDVGALKDEPYYAPGIQMDSGRNSFAMSTSVNTGSGASNHESNSIERQYKRDIYSHPCNESELILSREYCRDSIETCFVGKDELIQELTEVLCSPSVQSCQRHMLIGDLSSSTGVDQGQHFRLLWRNEWDRHHEDMNRLGGILFVFIGLLLMGLVFCTSRGGEVAGKGWRQMTRLILSGHGPRTGKRVFDLNKRKKIVEKED